MTIKELYVKITEDEELKKKFEGISSVDDLVTKAKELGFELDAKEIAKCSDLSDDDLNKVTGGMAAEIDITDILGITVEDLICY